MVTDQAANCCCKEIPLGLAQMGGLVLRAEQNSILALQQETGDTAAAMVRVLGSLFPAVTWLCYQQQQQQQLAVTAVVLKSQALTLLLPLLEAPAALAAAPGKEAEMHSSSC